jgi:hypothetical protein
MVAVVRKEGLFFNSAPEQIDKSLIDLYEIKPIARLELPKDFPRDGTRARANLQDSARAARLAKFRSQGPAQKSATGKDRPGLKKSPPSLPKKTPTFRPITHSYPSP